MMNYDKSVKRMEGCTMEDTMNFQLNEDLVF